MRNVKSEENQPCGECDDPRASAAGMISMKRIVGRCVFCGADKELRTYKGRFVCAACAAEIGKEDGHV